MKTTIRLVVAVLVTVSSVAAQEARFGLWSATELSKRDSALSTKVGADHSSRETLADYGHHRFRLLYRDADGLPEQHDTIVDVAKSPVCFIEKVANHLAIRQVTGRYGRLDR